MFFYRVQTAAGSQAWLAKGTLSVYCFFLSQRAPAKVGELLVLQLPCKHSNKGWEGWEGGEALPRVAGGQKIEWNKEGVSHQNDPPSHRTAVRGHHIAGLGGPTTFFSLLAVTFGSVGDTAPSAPGTPVGPAA